MRIFGGFVSTIELSRNRPDWSDQKPGPGRDCTLNPMKSDDQPAYEFTVATESGETWGTKASNLAAEKTNREERWGTI